MTAAYRERRGEEIPGTLVELAIGSGTTVLAAALRQVPARFRRKALIRVDGAGASHDLIEHLLSLSTPRETALFTCGWTIMPADEDAIRQVPAAAWKPGATQDGKPEDDKDVAEITGLMTRAGNWPGGLRWIARSVKPSRRHLRDLTDYEKKTGWKYSITCTNIPEDGIGGVPGSHHAQYIDAVHRQHAVVEITVTGKGRKTRTVKISHDAARAVDRYLRARARHAQAHRPQLWLGTGNRGPMTTSGLYQAITRRGRQCGLDVTPHRFRHHFSHAWLDHGGAEGDLMELNGWASPQMLRRYGASARGARARRHYDHVMDDAP